MLAHGKNNPTQNQANINALIEKESGIFRKFGNYTIEYTTLDKITLVDCLDFTKQLINLLVFSMEDNKKHLNAFYCSGISLVENVVKLDYQLPVYQYPAQN